MADRRARLPQNLDGEFFVDSTCNACRQIAPAVFAESEEYSFVRVQPRDAAERRDAVRALLACPTGSIGGGSSAEARLATGDFPLPIADDVFYCGFNSPKSYGGSSYFVRHREGNWLVDSPRYVEHLARRLEAMGGIANIFLTHRDDVADAEKYPRRFNSRRIIHRLELDAQPNAESVIDSFEPVTLAPGFVAIPTPGHTRGHCALLYENRFLFTGDHLWWSRDRERLHASRSVCWYSWPKQIASIEALREYSFEWILPGHGQRAQLSREEIRAQLDLLIGEIRAETTRRAY